jgi:hypothetical protein
MFIDIAVSVALSYCDAERHYTVCRYAECRGVDIAAFFVTCSKT